MGDSVNQGGKRSGRGPGRPVRDLPLIVRGVRKEKPDWDAYVSVLIQHAMKQVGGDLTPEEQLEFRDYLRERNAARLKAKAKKPDK